MVAQQAFSPQILKGKATIPWVKTRAGVPNLRDDQTKLELFTLVAKLVDASDSKSDGGNFVGVQVPFPVLQKKRKKSQVASVAWDFFFEISLVLMVRY